MNNRLFVSGAAWLVSLTVFLVALANSNGPLHFLAGLLFVLFVPGWAIVGHFGLRSTALELSLTMALSLALLLLLSEAGLSWHLWHPVALEEITSLLCLPSLSYLIYRERSPRA